MRTSFIFSGAGGQGMLSLGVLLASLAMEQGYEVTYFPSYGPEMRGGTAHCHVIIDHAPISSPRITKQLNYLIAMNQPSYDKFKPIMASDGHILYNSNLCEGASEDIAAPLNELAYELGGMKSINMIAFGMLCKQLGLFELENVLTFIDHKFADKPQFQEINRKAFLTGYQR
ncbi:MAG: 2-oxoacid:acceptor oxidoreductase family protein [Erysipelotrichaceae bacterium]